MFFIFVLLKMIPNAGPENVGANTAGDNLPNALQKNTKDSIAFILYIKKWTIVC